MKMSVANIVQTLMSGYDSKGPVLSKSARLAKSSALLVTGALLTGTLLVSHAQAGTRHVVESGETLKDIAEHYNISKTELIDANGVELTDVRVGQVLEVPDKNKRHNLYRIKADDTLSSLSKKYNVDITELARVNNLTPQSGLLINSTLVIPVSKKLANSDIKAAKVEVIALGATPATKIDIIKDSIEKLAPIQVKAVTSVEAADEMPIIQTKPKPINQVRAIPVSFTAVSGSTTDSKSSNSKNVKLHMVRYGESLAKIASSYQVNINSLAQANDMKVSDTLYFGKSLIIPVAANKTSNKAMAVGKAASAPVTVAKLTVPKEYKVQPGDTLIGIANKFNLDFRAVAKLSNVDYYAPLEIGQVLIFPNDAAEIVNTKTY